MFRIIRIIRIIRNFRFFRNFFQSFHTQADLAVFDTDDFHFHLIADFQYIRRNLYALLGNL